MRAILAASAALLAAATAASAQTYQLRPFTIPGATSVAVAAVTDAGLAAGRYASPAQPSGAGFVGTRRGVSTMAMLAPASATFPSEYIPNPTSMNDHGTVVGTYLVGEQIDYFAWRDGAYLSGFGQDEDTFPPIGPSIGSNNRLCYNQYPGDGITRPYAGTTAGQSLVPVYDGASVVSINEHGNIAGTYYAFVGSTERQAVFTYETLLSGMPHTILPPGAQYAAGGWINDTNQVAGSYQDAAGLLHGFITKNPGIVTFDLPTKPDTLTTQGVDEKGDVVGVYTKGNTQWAFVYSNASVTRLKRFPPADTVHVAISHLGKFLAVSDTNPSGTARSWLVIP